MPENTPVERNFERFGYPCLFSPLIHEFKNNRASIAFFLDRRLHAQNISARGGLIDAAMVEPIRRKVRDPCAVCNAKFRHNRRIARMCLYEFLQIPAIAQYAIFIFIIIVCRLIYNEVRIIRIDMIGTEQPRSHFVSNVQVLNSNAGAVIPAVFLASVWIPFGVMLDRIERRPAYNADRMQLAIAFGFGRCNRIERFGKPNFSGRGLRSC